MSYKLKLLVLLLLITHSYGVLAQRVYESGSPMGIAGIDIEICWVDLLISEKSIDSVKSLNAGNRKIVHFAVQQEYSLDRTNSGIVSDKGNVTIWHLPVRSKGAESLNVIFTSFRLEKGEKLYVYDTEKTTVRGPYTWQNNNDKDILAVLPVPGDEMIIELQLNINSSSVPTNCKGVTRSLYFTSKSPSIYILATGPISLT